MDGITSSCLHRFRLNRNGRALLWTIVTAGVIGSLIVLIYRSRGPRSGPLPSAVGNGTDKPLVATGTSIQVQPVGEGGKMARAVSVAPDKAETRTRIVLLGAGQGDKARPVVVLGRPVGIKQGDDWQGTIQSMLDRELIRQALLIAARDELGLATRDELLDDMTPPRGKGEPIEIAILFRQGECHALVRRGEGEKAEILGKYDLGTDPDNGKYTPTLVDKAEALSRFDFPELLKQLGLKGSPDKAGARGRVPKGVDERLEQLGLVDHIIAIRLLHEAIRADGESPGRLAGLARGYAQLGVLSEYQWNPAHVIFKARALLYSARLAAVGPRTPQVLLWRAFARALVGRHDLALNDIAEARKFDDPAAGPSKGPPWLAVIEAYLKSDRTGLAIKDGPDARLAALLNMMTVEYPIMSRAHVLAARQVLDCDADCCRAYDAICRAGQLGDLHVATAAGPAAFTKIFPVKLGAAPGLPPSVRALLDRKRPEPAVLDALQQAGRPGDDLGEPCWGVLAHLAREARFVFALCRLDFMARKWQVPVDDSFNEVKPSVDKHRYYAYLQSLALPPREGNRVLAALGDSLNLTEIESTERPLIDALRELKHPSGDAAWRVCFNNGSILARDIAERIRNAKARKDHFGRLLLTISPYSAYAMGTLVSSAWDQVKDEVPGWREKVGDAPALLGALARKHVELKQYDEAERELRRYMQLSPDRWAYQALADCYKARGDRDRWKATLDDFLKNVKPSGLQHAQIQVELANDLMRQGRWEEAKKYAEPAAETGAAFGMICASKCSEGLKDWDRAELWIRRASERYPASSWARWYVFCKRTGYGDVKAARDFAEKHLAASAGRPDLGSPESNGFFYWSVGSPKQALDYLERAYKVEPSPLHGIALALVADELNDKARRDRLFNELAVTFQGEVPRMAPLLRMIRESAAEGGKPLDLQAVDGVLDQMPDRTRATALLLVGRFLLNRGQPEAARKYLKRCTESSTHPWPQVLALGALQALDSGKPR
ncbi:MAG: tetratricopeptide repeat protein [Isosphaeraceae bacterium]